MKARTKKYCFSEDDQTLEELIAKHLIKNKQTISIAESCTGGLLSKRLTDIPGSSKYIKLNVVTYSNEAKKNILQVPEILINKYGAISSQVAAHMAIGIKNLAKTNIGVSITGIAGPTGSSKNKPVGLIYFGLARGNKVQTQRYLFSPTLTRSEIRWLASQFLLNWLRKELTR